MNCNTTTSKQEEGSSQTSYIFDERIGRKRRHDPWFAKLGRQHTEQAQVHKKSPQLSVDDNHTNSNIKRQKVYLDLPEMPQSGTLSIADTGYVTVAVLDLKQPLELTDSNCDSPLLQELDCSLSFLSDSDNSSSCSAPSSPASPLSPLDGSDTEFFAFDTQLCLDLPLDEYPLASHIENEPEWLFGLFN